MVAVELKLKEKWGADAKFLPADVGPHRAVSAGREQPWQALTSRQVAKTDGIMGNLPDRVEWGGPGDAEQSDQGADARGDQQSDAIGMASLRGYE
ncbi:hypothetical protein CYMTET_56103 [Cymbomonas tetramitiformis]|uniref:Uncharacterized protein n=1 Tax=Cymbomonas tetramitiformis TaxID=36881 RepID=A0AAE0BDC2_9CHLO|nr:hypothetical protein CYMTET_56103 [Cymbomonas tetramitiformis]